MIDRIYNYILDYKLYVESLIRNGRLHKRYSDITLPYNGDGDLQEVWYHRNADRWAKKEKNILGKHVEEDDTVIDVGANMGFITVIIGNMLGSDGSLYSFEPSEESFRKLEETIRANNLSDTVEAINKGCGSKKDTKHLYHVSSSSGLYTTKPDRNNNVYGREKIDIVSLDEFFEEENTENIDIIKIDTEGYEYKVLQGSKSIIRNYRPLIYLELCNEYKESSKKSVNLLKKLDYSFDSNVEIANLDNGSNFLAKPK